MNSGLNLIRNAGASSIRSLLIEKHGFDPYTLRDFYRLYMSDTYLENNVLRILGSGDSTMGGTGATNPITDRILYVAAALIREGLGMPASNRTGFVPSYLHGLTHPFARFLSGSASLQQRSATVPGYQLTRLDGTNAAVFQYDLPQGYTELYSVGVNRNGATANAAYTVVTGGTDPTGNITFRSSATDFSVLLQSLTPGLGVDANDKLEITTAAAAAGSQFWQSGIMICDSTNGALSQGGIGVTDLSCSGTMLYDAASGGIGLFRGDQVDVTPSAPGVYAGNQAFSIGNNISRWINNADTWGQHRLCFTNYGVNGQGATTISTATAAAELERIKLAQLWCDIRGSAANCFHVQIGHLGGGVARDAQLGLFNSELGGLCNQLGMPFINLMRSFQVGGRSTLPAGFDADGLHLTTTGYGEVGAVLAFCVLAGRKWYLAAKAEGLVA